MNQDQHNLKPLTHECNRIVIRMHMVCNPHLLLCLHERSAADPVAYGGNLEHVMKQCMWRGQWLAGNECRVG